MSEVQIPKEKPKIKPLFQDNCYFIKGMLNAMLNPVCYKDRNGVYLGVNDIYARQIAGLPEEEIIGCTMLELGQKVAARFPERAFVRGRPLMELVEEWHKHDTELFQSEGTSIYEYEGICADGIKREFLANRSIFRSEKGEILGLITVLQDITERNEARKSLQESEERYRVVTEQTEQLVYEHDLENYKVSWAGAVEKVFGYSIEEVKKFGIEDWFEHIHPEDRTRVIHTFTRGREPGIIESVEYRLRRKDGTYICVEDKGTYFENLKGKPSKVLGAVKDITEQKMIRGQLEKSEERYRIIVEQTGQLVYDYDLRTNRGSWTGDVEEITGYTAEEFQKFDWTFWVEKIHPEDREHITKKICEAKNAEKKFQQELRFRRKDGTYICVENSGVFLLDEKGSSYRVLGVLKDITERKLVQENLLESEEKYRSFIQSFEGIVFQLDNNLSPEFMYGEVEEITGYFEEEFLLGNVLLANIIHPEDRHLFLKDHEEIQCSPHNLYRKLDFRLVHRNGKIKWVREIYRKVQGEYGKLDKYQGNLYDITEKREAEIALRRMEIYRQKEIHHRIKNNLQVISSLLDLQAEKFQNRECIKDSEVLEAFRESQDRVVSISLIHEELHEGAGTNTLNFSLYLKRLIKNLFNTYRLGNADVRLKMELEEEIFFDMDTAVPLGLIVNELVSNSLKHAFLGRNTGEIHIKLSREENIGNKKNNTAESRDIGFQNTSFILKISDNGIGISRAVDIENSDRLGIQLVNLLVEQLEGEIEVKRDNGTEFIIKINVAETV